MDFLLAQYAHTQFCGLHGPYSQNFLPWFLFGIRITANLSLHYRTHLVRFGLKYVYCWHGLPAYWAGISPDAPEMAPYGANVMYAQPTPGVLEIEPSMAWNPAVLAGGWSPQVRH